MNKKITAITLLILTAFAAIIGGLVMTARATETDSTTTDMTITSDEGNSPPTLLDWGMREMMMPQEGFGSGPGGHGRHQFGVMGNVEVSSEYNATVTAILDGDADVQNLVSEGYSVQSINPLIKTVIEADGTVAPKATTAIVLLQNGTSGYATVKVDVTNAKVTEIVVITRTVIDKTSS